jgi:hypothetical protein
MAAWPANEESALDSIKPELGCAVGRFEAKVASGGGVDTNIFISVLLDCFSLKEQETG